MTLCPQQEKQSCVLGLGPVFKVSQLCLGGPECTVVPKLGLRTPQFCPLYYFICFNMPESTNRLINRGILECLCKTYVSLNMHECVCDELLSFHILNQTNMR